MITMHRHIENAVSERWQSKNWIEHWISVIYAIIMQKFSGNWLNESIHNTMARKADWIFTFVHTYIIRATVMPVNKRKQKNRKKIIIKKEVGSTSFNKPNVKET